MTQAAAFDMLRRVRAELGAGQFALSRVLAQWKDDAEIPVAAKIGGVTETELLRCAQNLESTYVLRLFSTFEAILRDFWLNGVRRNTEPEMRRLMNSVATRRGVNADDLALAHQIREYRNNLIHENLAAGRFDFYQCLRGLSLFLRWLLIEW
jgi:hypothetical protein